MSACKMRDSHLLYNSHLTMRKNKFPDETPEGFTLPFSQIPFCDAQGESVPQFRRRKRTKFTREQISAMETMFGSNRYPNIYVREWLGELIGQPESRIHVWFQNRRVKLCRQLGGARRPSVSPSCTVLHGNSPDRLHPSAPHEHQGRFPDLSGSLTSGAGLSPTSIQSQRREGISGNDHLMDATHRRDLASNQINVKVEDPRPPAPQATGVSEETCQTSCDGGVIGVL
eukprot:gi/632961093/ref/XP_007896561.1/ PREDICTED: homeobox protein MIXL1 [Callorhinchus milii]